MPDRINGAFHPRARKRLLSSSAVALLLCRCSIYDSGLVDRARDGGQLSSGSGGSANQAGGTGGEGSTGGTASGGDAGSSVPGSGSGGAIESGGAAGTPGSNGGGAGASGSAGAIGAGGACSGGGGATDLVLFQNGTFVPGWSTTGSWKTCNGTPINATVNATVALAVDLSCNTFNGAYIINWNSLVPPCTYTTLSFDIYFASPADITPLKVYLQNAQGPTGLLLDVTSLIASPQSKAFNHVSLPLTSFGTDLVFNGVGLFNASAAGIPLFYVNNVVLGAGSAADAGSD
jgi:hypothetical protein